MEEMHEAGDFWSTSSSDAEIEDADDVLLTSGAPPPAEAENSDTSPTEEREAQNGETQDAEITIHARAYQLEMLEASLKRNIIVAMDTGTGKTQVAVLRIKAELDMSPPDELIWFLAPTVALCAQQLEVLKTQIRSVQMKLLSGADNCDTWSEPRIWDNFLKNVRVVVSTHQVLYDAISHAFIQISRLSLIVFDEAHRCSGSHPGSKIMARYHLEKSAGLPVPAILGLTATPITKSRLDDLEVIEKTLDAVCRSPSVHRDQLMSMVKRPEMVCELYTPERPSTFTRSMQSLIRATQGLEIYTDPEIIRLRDENTERSRVALQKALDKGTTRTITQMKSLCRKSIEVWSELGAWAADYFIFTAISQFLASVKKNDLWFETWRTVEKLYLAGILQKVEVNSKLDEDTPRTSKKVDVLVRELLASPENSTGIVFACQTVTVAVLAHILSRLPSVKSRFRVDFMFGTSRVSKRKRDVGELYREDDYGPLKDFQDGNLNLLVATDVLEEGIDVPACNLVVCFDPLTNLKSLIQRRGRARAQESRLVLIIPEETDRYSEWEELEKEMKKKYEDELREIQHLASIEEEEEKREIPPLRIAKTGAQLDFDQAKSHLEHVCTSLTSRQYVESRPYYINHETRVSHNGPPIIKSTVVLPVSFPPDLRRFEGERVWYSEKNATKDAAFQAFVALYKAGLVNDHLMPLKKELKGAEAREAKLGASELWNPWPSIALAWDTAATVNMRQLRLVDQHGQAISEFDASLPDTFPNIPAFNLYWDKINKWKVEVGDLDIVAKSDLKPDQSMTLIDLAYGHRTRVDNIPHVLHLQSSQVLPFHEAVGQRAIEQDTFDKNFLVRFDGKIPYFYESSLPSRPSQDLVQHKIPSFLLQEPVDVPWLALKGWPKRRDFLHPAKGDNSAAPSSKPYRTIRPAFRCRVDGAHVSVVQFGALVPTIVHTIENYLIADELRKTILKELAISDLSLVVTAISSSAAHESTNYQRLEFLGDSILKLLTSTNVAANHPNYPEGYLSLKKDQVVSNSRLCRSTIETGLDKFILTKAFTGAKWQPLYIEDLVKLDPEELGTREISTKTLADVVESLIGASFLDGGIDKALNCIRIFIPEVDWHTLDAARYILTSQKSVKHELPSTLIPLEGLLGYTFRNKTLAVEAMTHPSFNLGSLTEMCMERLEFIGDAILDNVIVSYLWDCGREYSHHEMNLLRAACVNGDLLGFLMMEWAYNQETTSISSGADHTTMTETFRVPIWKLMRHSSQRLGGAQSLTEENHAVERGAILRAMREDTDYPWALLAHLQIPKSFSDLFESILGAVWTDSGSMEACGAIAERAGILPYLRRMLADGVEVAHPKNKLGELAGKDANEVGYETELRRKGNDGRGPKEWVCKVSVGGEQLLEVGGGVNREEIVTKAADAAYKLLKHGDMGGDDVVMI